MNAYKLFGLDIRATKDQIQEAYNKKRAELIGDEDSKTIAEDLESLDRAYQELINTQDLAITISPLPPPPIDPILGVVDSIDTPIHVPSNILSYKPCPFCDAPNPSQAIVCKTCGKQISRTCPNCGFNIILGLDVCPRCDTIISEKDQTRLAEALLTDQMVKEERLENQIRVEALEKNNRMRAIYGIILIVALVFAGIAICALVVFGSYYFTNQ